MIGMVLFKTIHDWYGIVYNSKNVPKNKFFFWHGFLISNCIPKKIYQ